METVQGIKVRQKRPNLWTTTVRVEPGPQGRRSIYGRTEAEVTEKALAMLAEVQQLTRDLPKYEVGTFADFVYATYRPRVLKKRKATTQRSYDSQLSLHILPGLGHLPIRAIGFEELGAWADSLTRKTHKGECTGQPLPDRRKTECILRAKEILHLFGQLASGKGEQVRTDWRLVETPKKRRKADPQEPEEGYGPHTQKLLEASMGSYMAGPHFCAAVLGLRRGEVCGLTWDRIDRKRMTIRIDRQLSPETGSEFVSTKGDTRTIPVTPAILGMIDKLGSRDSIFVFADKKGHHLRPNEVSKRTPAICGKAEITPVTFHTLRHHAASNLLALGVDLVTVCEVLGHTDIKTTMIYVSARNEGKREGLQLALGSILGPVENEPVSVDKDAPYHRQEA